MARALTTTYAEEAGYEDGTLPALQHELQWQRNDVRIFAHAAAETQVAIKDALATKFANFKIGPDTITQSVNDPGFLEVFPRVASRPPKLLQELEAILVDRLRANDKAASVGPLGSARDRDPKLAANLSLDAHRQVLAAFVAGFSTYAPLLSRIQAEFDRALNEGVRSAQENVEMRYAMAKNEMDRERATAEVRGHVLAEDLAFRATALSRLHELRERAARAEKKKQLAEKDLREARAEEARMRALVEQLRATNTRLTDLLAEEDRWAAKPLSSHLQKLKIGPLTREDEAFLALELGGMEDLHAATPSAAASAAQAATSLYGNSSPQASFRRGSPAVAVAAAAATAAVAAGGGGDPAPEPPVAESSAETGLEVKAVSAEAEAGKEEAGRAPATAAEPSFM